MFKWGIIGPGVIAHEFADGLSQIEDAELYAVASNSAERAKKFAEKYGAAKVFTSYDKLANCSELDAVYISTTNPYHLAPALMCLENKTAVLCEKPLSLNSKMAQEMIKKAEEKNTFFMEAMWTRLLPAIVEMRNWIEEGLIGKIRMVNAGFCIKVPYNPKGRMLDVKNGGGALIDLGVYPISFVEMLLGKDYKKMYSVGSLTDTGVDEQSAVLMQYSDGVIAQISNSLSVRPLNKAQILGTEGIIEVENFWMANSAKLVKEGKTIKSCSFDYKGGAYKYEALEVQKCLKQGKIQSDIMPWSDSIAVMDIMDKVREGLGLKYPQE